MKYKYFNQNYKNTNKHFVTQFTIDTKLITFLFRKYKQLNVKKIIIRIEKESSLVFLCIKKHKMAHIVSLERAEKIVRENKIKELALNRSIKRLGKQMQYSEMNPIEKKIVGITSKKWRALMNMKRQKEAEKKIKERREKPRHKL